tara:strand:+ start:514 stop:714 length:201 start_codon:yes stop_codon:yes gene_type:complete
MYNGIIEVFSLLLCSLQYTTDDWNNTALVRSIRREYHYNSSSTVDGTTALIILTNFVVFGMWKVKR